MAFSFGDVSAPPSPSEALLVIAQRLFPQKNLEHLEKVDTLTIYEVILLHYRVEPIEILAQPEKPLPYKPKNEYLQELIDYINQYFCGSAVNFLKALDENQVLDLIERTLEAGNLKHIQSNYYPSILSFPKDEIIDWIGSKNSQVAQNTDCYQLKY